MFKGIFGEVKKLAVPFLVLTVLDNIVGSAVAKAGEPQTLTGQAVKLVSGMGGR